MRLDNPKDKDSIQENLRQGEATEFWQLILQAIKDSVDDLQEKRDSEYLIELPPEQYKVEAELIKAKIANLKWLKELPQTLVQYLDAPDQREKNFDPYYTAEELKKAR